MENTIENFPDLQNMMLDIWLMIPSKIREQVKAPPKPIFPHCSLRLGSRGVPKSLDKNTDILNRICNHYDSIVPVMKNNQEVVVLANEDSRTTLDKMYDGIFSTNES